VETGRNRFLAEREAKRRCQFGIHRVMVIARFGRDAKYSIGCIAGTACIGRIGRIGCTRCVVWLYWLYWLHWEIWRYSCSRGPRQEAALLRKAGRWFGL
jgi:hypothetical protein